MRRTPALTLTLSVIGLGLGLALAGCVAPEMPAKPAAPQAVTPMQAMVSDQLFFGRTYVDGRLITDDQWTTFLAEIVTPRFPAGLTVWRADGQWRGANGQIAHEPSMVLQLLHADDAAAEKAIAEIIAEYRKRFAQESVMRVHGRVEVSF